MSDRLPPLAWGHINLNVRDLDRSIAFYEKLGFEVFIPAIPYLGWKAEGAAAELPPDSARALGLDAGTRGRGCIMQLGSGFPMLDLSELDVPAPAGPLGSADLGLVRICLASSDLERDYARLSDQDVEFLSAPQSAKDGLAEIAVCVDPDGTRIELIQVHLERWPRPSTRD